MPPYRGVGGVSLPRDGIGYVILKQALIPEGRLSSSRLTSTLDLSSTRIEG